MNTNRVQPTVVVGAGQAGLAVGASLLKRGVRPIVLERNPRLGASWRNRWDSLRLFTPAEHDGLPGLPFPARHGSFPSKDEMADYLVDYASHSGLDVTTSTAVTAARNDGTDWVVTTTQGDLRAARLVVATGTNTTPSEPSMAAELDPHLEQLHACDYRNPEQIAAGDVLVVGAGTSGAEIALELAATHRVFIAGRPTVHIPDVLLRRAGGLYWRLVHSALTTNTPMGRAPLGVSRAEAHR